MDQQPQLPQQPNPDIFNLLIVRLPNGGFTWNIGENGMLAAGATKATSTLYEGVAEVHARMTRQFGESVFAPPLAPVYPQQPPAVHPEHEAGEYPAIVTNGNGRSSLMNRFGGAASSILLMAAAVALHVNRLGAI